MSNMQRGNIKTFVFFDSETTGLPHQEHNKTRIVELCFAAVQTDHLSLGVFPRIVPKLNLCFNPRKFIQPGATEVTGLTNELVEEQPEFNITAATLLHDFLQIQPKPVCFIAHNGNRFDYPILRAELNKAGRDLSTEILCIDSLVAFKALRKAELDQQLSAPVNVTSNVPIDLQDGYDELLFSVLEDLENSVNDGVTNKCIQKPLSIEEIQKRNETTPQKQIIANMHQHKGHLQTVRKQLCFGLRDQTSFKLSDLYETLTNKEAIDAHKAEVDVIMLIECVGKVGQQFIDWANLNAVRFCDIPMMQPGKYIGK